MKIIVLIFVLIFVFDGYSSTQVEEKPLKKKKKFSSLIFISAGMPFSSGSTEFFNIYNNEFKGFKKDFKLNPTIGAGTKFRFEGNYRLGAQFLVQNSTLRDFYGEEVKTIDYSGYRNYGQTINITDIPIVVTGEYLPYTGQFRTYIGGGLGFVMRNIDWLEQIGSSIPLDYRKGGNNYNSTDIYPFIKIYSGLELGFDRMSELTFLGSLVIEASYNYTPAQTELFKKVKNQFIPESPVLNDKLNLLPGYFIISLAITFNFNQPA
jgi:hypothetical protein